MNNSPAHFPCVSCEMEETMTIEEFEKIIVPLYGDKYKDAVKTFCLGCVKKLCADDVLSEVME